MGYQLISFFGVYLWLFNFGWLVVYLDCFFHVLLLEGHQFMTFLNACHFICDCLVQRACQILKRNSIPKTKQNICLWNYYLHYLLFVALLNPIYLSWITNQNCFRWQMVNFFHVKIQCINLWKCWDQIVHILRQVFWVTYETQNPLLLVKEFLKS